MLIAFFLLALTFLSSFALALGWGRPTGRADGLMMTFVLWNVHMILPVYLLGISGVLYAWTLALATICLGIAGIVVGLRRLGGPGTLATFFSELAACAKMPLLALRELGNRREACTIALVIAVVLWGWALASTYLLPLSRYWDETWYHEGIVGFTIQNHGFAMVSLPSILQGCNGMERLSEMTQLFTVIFTGRSLIELPNVLFWPLLILACYAIAFRFTAKRRVALAAAITLALMPGCVRWMQSNLIDLHGAALLLAAVYFVVHPKWDRQRIVMAVCALALTIGCKALFAFPVLCLCAVATWRIRGLSLPTYQKVLVTLGCALPIVAMSGWTHIRNLIYFHNPFWPYLTYHNERLGIHWVGYVNMQSHFGHPMNRVDLVIANLLAKPYSVSDAMSSAVADYGPGIGWILLPLSAVALAWIVLDRVRSLGGRPVLQDNGIVMFLALMTLASFYISPGLSLARYHIASIGLMLAFCAYVLSHLCLERVFIQALFAAQIASIMMVFWAQPPGCDRLLALPRTLRQSIAMDKHEREYSAKLFPVIEQGAGQCRQKYMTAGTIVGFDYLSFVGQLWNDEYSNRLLFLADPADPLGEARRAGVAFLYTRPNTVLFKQLATAADWECVGPFERGGPGLLYRKQPDHAPGS